MSRWSEYILNRRKTDPEFREKCRIKINMCRKRANWRRKLRIIDGYGGKCVCCDEGIPEFLGIDHINGGGNEHRRQMRKGKGPHGGTQTLYAALVAEDFPTDEYQLLCMNCNFAKTAYGECPHVTARRKAESDAMVARAKAAKGGRRK